MQQPGAFVPGYPRVRSHLGLGDSRVPLPELLSSIGRVCTFFHDSDRAENARVFEFEAAFPKMRACGLPLSDETKWNDAWDEFCAQHSLPPNRVVHMGVVRKP